MLWRLLSVLVIALTLVINVFAVTALFDAWQIADTGWKPAFYDLGKFYVGPVTALAQSIQSPIQGLIGDRFELPCWWIHILAIYAASAGAIWAGTMSRDERNQRIGHIQRGGVSMLFPLAILGTVTSLIIQGFRNRVVSQFFTQHTGTAFTYAIAVFGLYAAANWANLNLLTGSPSPGQEVQLVNDPATSCTFNDGNVMDQMRQLASLYPETSN